MFAKTFTYTNSNIYLMILQMQHFEYNKYDFRDFDALYFKQICILSDQMILFCLKFDLFVFKNVLAALKN